MKQKEYEENHQGDDTNPPGGMGCRCLEIPPIFLPIIILQKKLWPPLVLTDLDPKDYRF